MDIDLNASYLFWDVLFSAIGLGFFMYGKKQQAMVPLVCGLLLMVFPYFVTDTLWLVVIGGILVATPYFLRV